MTADDLATQIDALTDTIARLEAQYEDMIACGFMLAAVETALLLHYARQQRHSLNEQLLALSEQGTPTAGEDGG